MNKILFTFISFILSVFANAQQIVVTIEVMQHVTCNAGNDGVIKATLQQEGNSPATYNWYQVVNNISVLVNQNTSTITALGTGDYYVVVTAAGWDPGTSNTVNVSEPPAISASANAGTIACHGGTTTLTVNTSGGVGQLQYSLNGGAYQQENTFIVNAAGSPYTVTVRDATSCTKNTNPVSITQPSLLTVSTSSTPVTTIGGSDGTATAIPSGGTPGYTYAWTNGGQSSTATGLTEGQYTVLVIDAYGCTVSGVATVGAPVCTLTASANAGTIACHGGTSTLTVNTTGGAGQLQYSLNGGAYQPENTFIVNAAGSPYTVTVRDATSCTKNTNPVSITQPSLLTVSTSSTPVTTIGGSDGTVTAIPSGGTPGYTYLWTPGGQSSSTATGLTEGQYTVEVKDASGCTVSGIAPVGGPVCALTASANAGTIACYGGTTTLTVNTSGGIGKLQYSLNGGAYQQENTFIVNAAGSPYTVTVRDASFCTKNTNPVSITQPSLLTVSTSSIPVTTIGGSDGKATVIPSGGTPGYTYLWTPGGQSSSTATGLTAGHYTVQVRDASGCTISGLATVGAPVCTLTASANAGTIACHGGTITLTVNTSGGVGQLQYSLNGGAYQPENTFIVNAAGSPYTVTVRDGILCTKNTNSVTVTQPSILSVSASASPILCNGGTSTVVINATGGTAPYTGTGTFTNISAGSYSYQVTDSKGCLSTTNFSITQPTALTTQVNATPVSCFGAGNGEIAATVSGGVAPYQYQWTTGANTPMLNNLAAGNYFVLITDANLCSKNASIVVGTPAITTLSGDITSPSCIASCNGSIKLTVTGGTAPFTYVWSNGATTKDILGICSGSYSVTITDAKNCTSSKTFIVTDPAPFSINLGADRTLCTGQNFEADATINATGVSYQWTATNTFISSAPKVVLTQAGSYFVRAITGAGCIVQDTIIISNSSAQIASEFLVSTQVFKGTTVPVINITSPKPDNITWLIPSTPAISIVSTNQIITELIFNDTGTYFISMRARVGACEKISTQKVIAVLPQAFDLISPVTDPLILVYSVSPNPNNGQFVVRTVLKEISKIRLRLINIISNAVVDDRTKEGSKEYFLSYSGSVTPGIYLLLLETAKASRVFKIIVN